MTKAPTGGQRAPASVENDDYFLKCMQDVRRQANQCVSNDAWTQHPEWLQWIGSDYIAYNVWCRSVEKYTNRRQDYFLGGCGRLIQSNSQPIAMTADHYGTPACQAGSIIFVDNRVLGEQVEITASPHTLTYFTDRSQGYKKGYRVFVPWTPISAVLSLKFMVADEQRTYQSSVVPIQPSVEFEYIWDGKDANGQLMQGGIRPTVSVSEEIPVGIAPGPAIASALGEPESFTFATSFNSLLGGWRAKAIGLGGWNISNHHFYAHKQQRIYYGWGGSQQMAPTLTTPEGTVIPAEGGDEVYVFNAAGEHVTTRRSLKGELIYRFNYDSARRLASIEDAFGNRTVIERNASGVATAIVAPFGQRTGLTMDGAGNLSSVTDSNGSVHTMTYANGLLKTFKRPGGQTSTFTYDAMGQLVKDAHSSGKSTTLTGDSTIETTSALGKKSLYARSADSDGNYTRSESVGYARRDYQWFFGLDIFTDWTGLQVNIQKAVDARFQHLVPVQTTVVTGVSNLIHNWGNEISRASSSDLFSTTSYREAGGVEGRNWEKTYDAATRKWTITSPRGRKQETVVDTFGRTVSQKLATFLPVQLSYDTRGRVTQIKTGTRTTLLAYNAAGFLDKITDPLSRTTSFTYDAGGRVLTSTDPQGQILQLAYNSNNQLVRLTPPGKPQHSLLPNAFELLGQYLPPTLTGVTKVSTEYAYNADGQLAKITNPLGAIATFTYEASTGVLQQIQTPEGDFWVQEKPETSLLEQGTSPDNIRTEKGYYTRWPQMIRTTDAGSGVRIGEVTLSYDSSMRPTMERVEAWDTSPLSDIFFGYDDDDLPIQVGEATLTRNTASGLLTQTSYQGVTTNFTYNAQFPEVATLEAKRGTAVLYRAALTRDAVGRITKKVETIGGVATTYVYEYDLAGRLIRVRTGSETGPIAAEYAYDANGNRLKVTRAGVVTASTYDAQDRMLTAGTTSFTYNANGVRTKQTQGATITNYTYGFFGNLRSVVQGTLRVEYRSDVYGRRVARKRNGAVTQYWIYDSEGRIVGESNAAGVLTKRFVYASRPHVPDQMITSGVKYALVTDHLGSVRLVVNTATGAVAQRMDYDEFGRVTKDTKPGLQPFGFAGGLYDQDTKLVRFGARDYDPETGRWLSKDPILFAGGDSNLYQYVMADPVNLIDPSGLISEKYRQRGAKFAGVGAIAGAVAGVCTSAGLGTAGLVVAGGAAGYAIGVAPGVFQDLKDIFNGTPTPDNIFNQ